MLIKARRNDFANVTRIQKSPGERVFTNLKRLFYINAHKNTKGTQKNKINKVYNLIQIKLRPSVFLYTTV